MRHIIVWFYIYKTNKCIKTYLTSYKTDLIDHPRVFFNFPNGLPCMAGQGSEDMEQCVREGRENGWNRKG